MDKTDVPHILYFSFSEIQEKPHSKIIYYIPRNSNMKPRRLLLSISIVSVAVTAASAANLFEEIGEELFDDVLRPILDIFPGSPPHPDYAGQGPYSI